MAQKKIASTAQIRIVVVLIIAAALLVFVFQNRELVETKFLVLDTTMPRALVILLTAAAGFGAGVLVGRFSGRKNRA